MKRLGFWRWLWSGAKSLPRSPLLKAFIEFTAGFYTATAVAQALWPISPPLSVVAFAIGIMTILHSIYITEPNNENQSIKTF